MNEDWCQAPQLQGELREANVHQRIESLAAEVRRNPGYRHDPVYLRTSRYVPPRWEVVRDAMPTLFDLLEDESEPAVRAVLGHWLFGYVHPYPDGNGRIARFLMNTMLASGGYPWTVVRIDDRAAYLEALGRASIDMDIGPFSEFMADRVKGA